MSDWSLLRALGLVCALLMAPAWAVWDGWSYIQLTNDGATVSAVVTDKTRHSSRHSTSYRVEYAFRDVHGRRWSGSQSIGLNRYNLLRIGQRLDIVYCRSNPAVSVAHLDVLREKVSFLTFASFVIALVVGALSWWWHYAQASTREHDAEVLQRARPA